MAEKSAYGPAPYRRHPKRQARLSRTNFWRRPPPQKSIVLTDASDIPPVNWMRKNSNFGPLTLRPRPALRQFEMDVMGAFGWF